MDRDIIDINEVKNHPAVPVIENEDAFLATLNDYKINDISDPNQVQIQKDGDRYIFTIFDTENNKTTFALRNKGNVEVFITAFLDRQKTQDQEVAVYMTWIERNQLIIKKWTYEEMQKLRGEVFEHNVNSRNPDKIEDRIDMLKDFFDAQKDESRREAFWLTSKYSRSPMERDFWAINKQEAKKRLKDLKNIETEFKKLNKKEIVENDELNYDLTKNRLINLSMQLDKLSANVPLFETQNNALKSGTTDITPDYKIDVARMNKSQAKRLLKTIKDYNEKQRKVSNISSDASQEHLKARDMSGLQAYLEWVVNWTINPSVTPFDPKWQDDYNAMVDFDKSWQNDYPNLSWRNPDNNDKNISNNNPNNPTTWNEQLNQNDQVNNNGKVKDQYWNWVDAVWWWWIFWWIDHGTEWRQDQSERWQKFYKSFGNVALLAGGIFLGIKALGATWRIIRWKKKEWDRWWLWWTAWLLLLTAGRPQDLFKWGYASEKFADLLRLIGIDGKKNDGSAESSQQSVEQSTTWAMALFNGMKYEDMAKIIETNNGKMKLKPDVRQARLTDAKNKLPTASVDEKANLQWKIAFLEAIGQNDDRWLLDLALTSMGVSYPTLSSSPNSTFNESAQAFIQRSIDLGELMNSKDYQKTNNESDEKIREYMAGNMTLEELENSGAFEKKVSLSQDVQNLLKSQIETLSITDDKDKQNLTEAVMQFYQDWPTSDKSGFKIEKDGDNIIISTYGEKTPITLDKKINWLPVTFDTTKEAIRVANLTNRIKNLSRNLKPAKDDKPFHIESMTTGSGVGWIAFDNQDRYKVWTTDVTMISTSWLEDVSKIISQDENKKIYVEYLNGLWHRDWWTHHNETTVVIPPPPVDDEDEDDEDDDVGTIDEKALEKDLEEIDKLTDMTDAVKTKVKQDYNDFYKKYPSFKTIGVELVANGSILNVNSYKKTTPIDFSKSQIEWLNIDFDNFEDLFKTANLTNKIRNTFQNIESESIIDPFHVDAIDIKFDNKSLRDRKPDVAAVSDWLWRGWLEKTSAKLAEGYNKDLYVKYLNDLRLIEDKSLWFFNLINNINTPDKKQKIIDWFKSFYKNHPSEEKDIKLGLDQNWNAYLETYDQITNIDINWKKISGLSLQFSTYEELFKIANLINKTKSITEEKETSPNSDWEVFDITYLWALEFYWKEKTIRIFDETWLTNNSEKFYERANKFLLESYLNERWKNKGTQGQSDLNRTINS